MWKVVFLRDLPCCGLPRDDWSLGSLGSPLGEDSVDGHLLLRCADSTTHHTVLTNIGKDMMWCFRENVIKIFRANVQCWLSRKYYSNWFAICNCSPGASIGTLIIFTLAGFVADGLGWDAVFYVTGGLSSCAMAYSGSLTFCWFLFVSWCLCLKWPASLHIASCLRVHSLPSTSLQSGVLSVVCASLIVCVWIFLPYQIFPSRWLQSCLGVCLVPPGLGLPSPAPPHICQREGRFHLLSIQSKFCQLMYVGTYP